MDEYGDHTARCCAKHGCKYGDKNCPVINRVIKQQYFCERCDKEGIKSIEELYDSIMNYESMWNELN